VAETYSITVVGRPVPKKTMTAGSKWKDERAKKTLAYQEAVGLLARARYPGLTIIGPVSLTVKVFLRPSPKNPNLPTGQRGDLSNYIKAAEDGLQYAGIIKNDKQIIRYGEFTGIYPTDGDEHLTLHWREIDQ
jgi:Holliday junction resolvase RusA-like endonuclease